MPNFFKSFFSGKSETPESEKQKNDQKNPVLFFHNNSLSKGILILYNKKRKK